MKVVFMSAGDSLGEPLKEAIALLLQSGVPVIPCTGLPQQQVQGLRARLRVEKQPFVVEHGGALFVPEGYFPFSTGFMRTDGFEVATYGETRAALRRVLAQAALETGCEIGAAEDPDFREFAATFRIQSGEPQTLLAAIEKSGRLWKRTADHYAIVGNHDRRLAIMVLTRFFYQISRSVLSIGLGESLADLDLLSAVDRPVVVHSRDSDEIRRLLPSATVTGKEGADGWVEALLLATKTKDVRTCVVA